ncbi:Protein mesA [Yarrowia sp. C11]|nr:Protein mesA [Yarrowia sp. E02]KAG5369932.1 Protein mesA [Yarrowia sp. C11]
MQTLNPLLHIEYVLAAEFDIDAGPVVKYQYPDTLPGDEQLMAELMLPDQSHVRNQDWTIFFLHDENGLLQYRPNDKGDMFYVLNLVNTKFDKDVRRGAIVKSMCLITRYPYFQIFKPVLILALDEYFDSPSLDCLKKLYSSINSMSVERMPNFSASEKLLLAVSEDHSLFAERFGEEEAAIVDEKNAPIDPRGSSSGEKPTYYIDLKNRGHRLVSTGTVRDTHYFDSSLQYGAMKIPVKVPTAIFPETVGDFSLIRLLRTLQNIKGPFKSVHPQLTIFGPTTPPVIVLINALLTQKRVLFIGYNTPSGDVADHVLAACFLASGGGILRGFTRYAFPYTDLSKVDDLLETPGFIAGAKNPTFTHHPTWYDVVVDIENFTMDISPAISSPVPKEKETKGNNPLFATISQDDIIFTDQVKRMLTEHYGESSIRHRCRNYLIRFVRIAISFEEYKYKQSLLWPRKNTDKDAGHGYVWNSGTRRLLDFQNLEPVIEGWRQSRSYALAAEDERERLTNPDALTLDVEHCLDKLKIQTLNNSESAAIYTLLHTNVSGYDDINTLLVHAIDSNLFEVALGLVHRFPAAREATCELLERIRAHPAGKRFFDRINPFLKVTFFRIIEDKRS